MITKVSIQRSRNFRTENTMSFELYLQCVIVWCVVAQPGAADDYAVVSLRPGQQLRGWKTVRPAGDVVYKFYGIPYAQPPTGQNRFQPPQPATDWSGVKDALTNSTICPQFNHENYAFVESEDCLYLNVFSPELNTSKPVLVWIHGGYYRYGSAYNDGDGATLAPRGIVVVTINYRLGPFGFLSTADDVMPGNYGMLDQVLALKWVQENIRAFGGDPAQVTIAGESAGASSVSMQIYSPLATGLFSRVIMESGSALCPWAVERPGQIYTLEDYTKRVAMEVGCDLNTSADILQCLRDVDVDCLMKVSMNVQNETDTNFQIEPRIETTFGFLPDYPETILRQGAFSKVNTLVGLNSGEESFWIKDPEDNGITVEEFRKYYRTSTAPGVYVNDQEIERLVEEIYLHNETEPFALRTNLIHALDDMTYGGAIIVEILKMLDVPNTTTKHFFYEFARRANGTTTPEWYGVAHAQERQFVFFDDSKNSDWATPDDMSVADDVQTMWSNFVKFGDPTPSNVADDLKVASGDGTGFIQWSAFTENNPSMLIINVESKMMQYPRPQLITMFERVLELLHMDVPVENCPIVG